MQKYVHLVDLVKSFPNSNEYLLAKIGVDTAENEPLQVCPLSAYRSPRFPPAPTPPPVVYRGKPG